MDDSFSAMDSTLDEEDAKHAFVRALTSGINSYENEDDDEDEENSSAQQKDVQEAQERLGTMLGEMLFSPKHSKVSDDGISSDDSKSDDNNGRRDNQPQRSSSEEENGNSDTETEVPQETMGLLTGEHATSLRNNLRPSIFTTISQQQVREVEDIWAKDDKVDNKNEEGSDGVSNQNEEGDLEEHEDLDFENTVGNNNKS